MQLCSNCGKQCFKPRVDLNSTDLRDILISAQTAAIIENVRLDLEDYARESPCCESRRKVAALDEGRLRECLLLSQLLPSPIQKLPDEILQIIFDYYCDTNRFELTGEEGNDDDEEFEEGPNARVMIQSSALIAASVCSRWRRNALAVSSIWARISLECSRWAGKCDDSQSEKLLSMLDLFISRSRQWSLDIDIDLRTEELGWNMLCLPETFFNRLQPRRWRTFALRAFDPFDIHQFFVYSKPSTFPILEELNIDLEEGEGTGDTIKLFIAAPKLQSVKVPYASDLEAFPLTELSHLDTTVLFAEDLERTFPPDSRFVSLRLSNDLDSDSEEWKTTVFSPSVLSLTVAHVHYGWDPERPSFFFLFTFPVLRTLHLEPYSEYHIKSAPWPNFDHFLNFIRRSACALTTFSFRSLPLSDSDLISILAQLPALLNLTIIDADIPADLSPITPKLFESLYSPFSSVNETLTQEGAPILPKLHTLILHIDAQTFEDVLVVKMVKSRWNPSARSGRVRAAGGSCSKVDCLRECTIKFHNREEPKGNVYDPLDGIEKEGMRLVVSWKNDRERV